MSGHWASGVGRRRGRARGAGCLLLALCRGRVGRGPRARCPARPGCPRCPRAAPPRPLHRPKPRCVQPAPAPRNNSEAPLGRRISTLRALLFLLGRHLPARMLEAEASCPGFRSRPGCLWGTPASRPAQPDPRGRRGWERIGEGPGFAPEFALSKAS